MSTVFHKPPLPPDVETIPPLENGDHLDQRTFHERYEQMPPGMRAELIGGIVYMPSPAKVRHGGPDGLMCTWMGTYRAATPGTEFLPNTTTILGDESEPQPDGMLIIVKGGQTRENDDEYLTGPPEFIAEVASSTESFDLHSKRRDYEKHGVQEYLVLAVRQKRAVWFLRENDRFVELPPASDGILRSRILPGLWLDPHAFFANDYSTVLAVLQQGLSSPEHAAFVAKLQSDSAKTDGV